MQWHEAASQFQRLPGPQPLRSTPLSQVYNTHQCGQAWPPASCQAPSHSDTHFSNCLARLCGPVLIIQCAAHSASGPWPGRKHRSNHEMQPTSKQCLARSSLTLASADQLAARAPLARSPPRTASNALAWWGKATAAMRHPFVRRPLGQDPLPAGAPPWGDVRAAPALALPLSCASGNCAAAAAAQNIHLRNL